MKSPAKSYAPGTHTETFVVDKIDLSFVRFIHHLINLDILSCIVFSGVKQTAILNMGLLSLSFIEKNENADPTFDVNMATEISKKKGTGQYMRSIMNPLE